MDYGERQFQIASTHRFASAQLKRQQQDTRSRIQGPLGQPSGRCGLPSCSQQSRQSASKAALRMHRQSIDNSARDPEEFVLNSAVDKWVKTGNTHAV
jgi:hypothetical protein